MALLITPAQFAHWAKKYHEWYGLRCVPMTGKNKMYVTGPEAWNGDEVAAPDGTPTISYGLVRGDNWLDRVCEAAEQYKHNLTGIGCVCAASGVVGIDFDDPGFFYHWWKTYKIKCPVVKTGKGYHAYLKADRPRRRILVTQYYTIQSWGQMMLPPSLYYQYDTVRRLWKRQQGVMNWYQWDRVFPIPEVNLAEVGLIPKWYLEEESENFPFDEQIPIA